jgi:hypothetical protein
MQWFPSFKQELGSPHFSAVHSTCFSGYRHTHTHEAGNFVLQRRFSRTSCIAESPHYHHRTCTDISTADCRPEPFSTRPQVLTEMEIQFIAFWVTPWSEVGGYQSFETTAASILREQVTSEQNKKHNESFIICTVIPCWRQRKRHFWYVGDCLLSYTV